MAFTVPSGRTFGPKDINLMKDFKPMGLIQWSDEPKILNSGEATRVYVRGRADLTEYPKVMVRAGARIMDALRFPPKGMDSSTFYLVGVPTAGNLLASAAFASDSVLRSQRGFSTCYNTHLGLIRENKKTHGDEDDKGWVIGKQNNARYRHVLIENTTTTGKGVKEAAERLVEDGYDLSEVDCLIFIERGQGALQAIASLGFRKIVVVYFLQDILFVYGRLGLWPKELVAMAQLDLSRQFVQ
jgi:orotate phosphoribosyltransferase